MAAPMVTSTVSLRSGERHEFSHRIEVKNGLITHEKLRESLQNIQKEVNDFLTKQVELEKGSTTQQNNITDDSQVDDKLEEDKDEDETNGLKEKGQGDTDSNKEQRTEGPPAKKPKK